MFGFGGGIQPLESPPVEKRSGVDVAAVRIAEKLKEEEAGPGADGGRRPATPPPRAVPGGGRRVACHGPQRELNSPRLAKPSPDSAPPPRLLVLELWGLGDLALAVPFLRAAALHTRVTLVAQPHAAPLLARFAPDVEHVPLAAPWARFSQKYRLHRWPWRELQKTVGGLRQRRFDLGVSARPDPRDHLLLALAGAERRLGFARAGSGILLQTALPRPTLPHRAAHWAALARELAWAIAPLPRRSDRAETRHAVIHLGAGQPVRRWPRERFEAVATRLRTAGWRVTIVDEGATDLPHLLDLLASAERFIGNDSGPGHLAALLGVPTFTIFGPQLPELFAPPHPAAAWIDGAPCPHKPCFDACRFAEPHCLLKLDTDTVWHRVDAWLHDHRAAAENPAGAERTG